MRYDRQPLRRERIHTCTQFVFVSVSVAKCCHCICDCICIRICICSCYCNCVCISICICLAGSVIWGKSIFSFACVFVCGKRRKNVHYSLPQAHTHTQACAHTQTHAHRLAQAHCLTTFWHRFLF